MSKNSFLTNVFKLASGNLIGLGISVITSPIISRLYSPSVFGTWSIFISVSAIITVISSFRYEFAIMLPEKEEEASAITILGMVLNFSTSILLLIPIIFWKKRIATILGDAKLEGWLWFLLTYALLCGFYNVFIYWRSRHKDYDKIAQSRISMSLATSCSQILLGFIKFLGAGGLIIGSVIGEVVGLLNLFYKKTWAKIFKLSLDENSISQMKAVAYRYKKFPLITIWTALINSLAQNIPVILLAYYFNPIIVGLYALGYRALQVPLVVCGQSISQVFFQQAAEEKNKTGSTRHTVEQAFVYLCIVGVPAFILLIILAPKVFALIFGSRWAKSGTIIQIMAPLMFFKLLSTPMSTMISVYEKQMVSLIWQIVLFIIIILSFILGGVWLKNEYYTFFFLSYLQSFWYLVLVIIIFRISKASIRGCLQRIVKNKGGLIE